MSVRYIEIFNCCNVMSVRCIEIFNCCNVMSVRYIEIFNCCNIESVQYIEIFNCCNITSVRYKFILQKNNHRHSSVNAPLERYIEVSERYIGVLERYIEALERYIARLHSLFEPYNRFEYANFQFCWSKRQICSHLQHPLQTLMFSINPAHTATFILAA